MTKGNGNDEGGGNDEKGAGTMNEMVRLSDSNIA